MRLRIREYIINLTTKRVSFLNGLKFLELHSVYNSYDKKRRPSLVVSSFNTTTKLNKIK